MQTHVKNGRTNIPSKYDISSSFRKVLVQMIHDPVSVVVKNDKDILLPAGENQLKKITYKKENKSGEMRTVGKLHYGQRY